MTSYKDKRLLYHFTALNNIPSIFEHGLLPRKQLSNFVDVADAQILENREKFHLDEMVPFHFFADNPFDGRVVLDNPKKDFVYITILRKHANCKGWQISPKHPLNGDFSLLDYDIGMKTINWEVMDQRNYRDDESRSICMAECLSQTPVMPQEFQSIFVSSQKDKQSVEAVVRDHKLKTFVNLNERMFPRRG